MSLRRNVALHPAITDAKLMKNVICGAVLAIIKSSNMLYNMYLRVFTCPVSRVLYLFFIMDRVKMAAARHETGLFS